MASFDSTSFSTSAFSPLAFDFGGGGSDTVPDSFAFAPATGAPLNTLVESGGAVVTGLTAAANVTIVGGEYSIDLGVWTSAPGTINNGQSIRVRRTSSALYATDVSVVVTIGGVPATFVIQTRGQKYGGDDYPGPRKRKKKSAPKPKRETLALSKDREIRGELSGMYRELTSEPATRERAKEIAQTSAPAAAKLAAVEKVRSLTVDNEIALRLLHKELMDILEEQDEEVIQQILARLL